MGSIPPVPQQGVPQSGSFQQQLFGEGGLSPSHIPIPSPNVQQHQRQAADGASSPAPTSSHPINGGADDASLLSTSPSSTTQPSPIQASQSPSSMLLRAAGRAPPGGFAARRFVVGPAPGSGLPPASTPTPGAAAGQRRTPSPGGGNENEGNKEQQQQWGSQEQEDFATSLEALEV
jgi:hypothetical protein